ncbi:MAG: hypothetical protein JWM76_2995 [Pseudonocardiales bacterium]|nr:hypothetical protein [Pseudonocardiales bacterium]
MYIKDCLAEEGVLRQPGAKQANTADIEVAQIAIKNRYRATRKRLYKLAAADRLKPVRFDVCS